MTHPDFALSSAPLVLSIAMILLAAYRQIDRARIGYGI